MRGWGRGGAVATSLGRWAVSAASWEGGCSPGAKGGAAPREVMAIWRESKSEGKTRGHFEPQVASPAYLALLRGHAKAQR